MGLLLLLCHFTTCWGLRGKAKAQVWGSCHCPAVLSVVQTSDLWLHLSCVTLPEVRTRREIQAPFGWQTNIKRILFFFFFSSFLASLIRRVLEQKKGKCGFPFAVTEVPQTNQNSLKSSQEATGNTGASPANWNTLCTPCWSHRVKFHLNVLYFHKVNTTLTNPDQPTN